MGLGSLKFFSCDSGKGLDTINQLKSNDGTHSIIKEGKRAMEGGSELSKS